MKNLHKYFYKDYFAGIDFDYMLSGDTKAPDETLNDIKAKNKILTGSAFAQNRKLKFVIPEVDNGKEEEKIVNESFPLEVMYPGLVTGIGIKHETKIDGEFKLGMHFDWTYGLPIIYGSSVKGILRSAFVGKVEKGKVTEYDDYFLKKAVTDKEWKQSDIKTLFNAIFEGTDVKGNNLSIYDRDIFFDAVLKTSDSKNRILCSDSITPHGDDPLKNPRPLTFVKIAPGCSIEFRFCLRNNCNLLSVNQKKELFQEILTTIGIGAKTNVGYGQLKEVKTKQ